MSDAALEAPAPRGTAAETPIPVPLGELFSIAAQFEQQRKLPEAERLLRHILAVAPRQPDALHLGGIVAFRLGRHAEALDMMERAIQYGIDTPLYLRNICEVYRTLGRLDEAVAAAKRAVQLAPSDPLCLHNLAIIHYERLEIDESHRLRETGAGDGPVAARRAFRAGRGAAAARRVRTRLGGVRVALPHRLAPRR